MHAPTRYEWMPAKPWVFPAGRVVLRANAPREEWLAARRPLITASEAAAALGYQPPNRPDAFTVWAEKVGWLAGEPANQAMDRGNLFEDGIVALWVKHVRDNQVATRRVGLMVSKQHPVVGATLDRASVCPIAPEQGCIIEAKSQADLDEWQGADGDDIPDHILVQILVQLGVSGRHHVHLVGVGPHFQPFDRIIYRDEHADLIAELLERLAAWHMVHITGGEAPAVTAGSLGALGRMYAPKDGTSADLPEELARAREEYEELTAEIKEAEQARDLLMARVKAAVGAAVEVRIGGQVVATWKPTAKIVGNTQAWRAAHPDLVAEHSVMVKVLDEVSLVKAHPELIGPGGQLSYQRQFLWRKTPKIPTTKGETR